MASTIHAYSLYIVGDSKVPLVSLNNRIHTTYSFIVNEYYKDQFGNRHKECLVTIEDTESYIITEVMIHTHTR